MYSPTVSIPNPDDPSDMPIFEGEPFDAQYQLIPGIYEGTADYSDLTGEELFAPGVLVVWTEKHEYPMLAWREGSGSVWVDHLPEAYNKTDDGYPYTSVPTIIMENMD